MGSAVDRQAGAKLEWTRRYHVFETLADKLGGVFRRLSSKGKLTEQDVDEALREVRLALLEADVNFKVVKEFVARTKERALGADVMESLSPAHQVVKIVNDELVTTLGGGQQKLQQSPQPPTVILVVGLQGAGKTTTTAKLALHLRKACDFGQTDRHPRLW
jgi:signal recognition particle subunit SRP54